MNRAAESSRSSIVLAVWRLIAHEGIEAVTFRRVAQTAAVSVGRVQHHFGNREQLVRAACAEMIEAAHAQYQELPEDPFERLGHILTHAISDTPQTRFGTSVWYAYLAKSVDDEQIGALLAETKRGTENECARLLEQLPGTGGVPVGADTRTVARRLLALADGLALRVLVGDLPGDEARELLAAELAGLGAHPAD